MPADALALQIRSVTDDRRRDNKIAEPTSAKTIVLPPPGITPDWSEKTLLLLSALTALQRAFTEWLTTGVSAAEAYRRASGRTGTLCANARNNACQLNQNPKVKAAIAAALADRNFGARMDREWKLQVIKQNVEAACESGDPRLITAIPKLLRLAAELQGELPWRPPESSPTCADQRADVRIRLREIVAEANGLNGHGTCPALPPVPASPSPAGR